MGDDMPSGHDRITHAQHSNSQLVIPPHVLAAMEHRRRLKDAEIRQRAELAQILQPTDEEISLRRKIRERHISDLVSPDIVTRLKAQRERRLNDAKALASKLISPPPLITDDLLKPLDPNGIGTLWWASTNYWTASNGPGGPVVFGEPDGTHFAGEFDTNGVEGLWKYSIYILATFWLGADRMPVATKCASSPFINITGNAMGKTWADPFDYGDQWSKAWLNTFQTVYVGADLGVPLPIARNSQTQTLIFTESSYDVVFYTFPGVMSMPAVSFPVDPGPEGAGGGIIVDLEATIDLQVEGDSSSVQFSNAPSCLLQTFQWDIQPV
jgi:hypothetical protein